MKRITIAVVGLALILSACSSAAEVLTEQIAENAVGGDVKIDADTGQVSIETDDGAITIGGGEIPDGFALPVRDGYQVTSVFSTDGASAVTLVYPGAAFDDVVSFYDDWTSSQSAEWSKNSSSMTTDDGTIDSASWFSDEGDSFITVSTLCIVPDE
ncbi:MAG: hypothetical protein GWP18_05560, partial [Proteobacteria bacterium]|nr:hypothetical protein [Pseudomonadota bacterium]